MVVPALPSEVRAVDAENNQHHDETCDNSRAGAHRAADRAENRALRLVAASEGPDQHPRREDRDKCVHDLFADLRDRCRRHRLMRLKIASEHAEDRRQKDRRREHAERRQRILLICREKDASAKERDECRDTSHDCGIHQSAAENLLRALVSPQSQSLRDNLRHRHRDTVRGNKEQNRIKITRISIVAKSDGAENGTERPSVDETDDSGDNRRHHKNGGIFHKIVFLLFCH